MEPDPQALNLRRSRALLDMIMAVRGHLRGEDWDKEMREALIEFDSTKSPHELEQRK